MNPQAHSADPPPEQAPERGPNRRRQSFVFRRHHFTVTGILDYFFFLFGGVASLFLALVTPHGPSPLGLKYLYKTAVVLC